jgi:hypothetical protein
MVGDRPTIPRGKYMGRLVDPKTGKPVEAAEADHFMRCPARSGVLDMRDLGAALAHHGPLPHPGEDQNKNSWMVGPPPSRGMPHPPAMTKG